MTPEQIARSGTESAHQIALFAKAMSELNSYPMLKWMYAIPNGGLRSKATAGRIRAEGARAGVWDIFLPYPMNGKGGLYIEMKIRKNKTSSLQGQFMMDLIDHYSFAVCYSWEEAWAAITDYLQ